MFTHSVHTTMKPLLLLLAAMAIAACSGLAGSASNVAAVPGASEQAVAPEDFSLHPPRFHFSSPQEHYKVEHVRGFGENGAIAENCIAKGVAEVAGDGLRGNTLIADVIPMAPGHCEATFTNGKGEKLKLPVTVGPATRTTESR
jgi:hypothetical protein